MLTASPSAVGWKNLKFSYGDASFAGSVSASGLKGDGKTPRAVNLTLVADKPVNLNTLLPAGAKGEAAPAVAEDKTVKTEAAGDFLPATLRVPGNLVVTFDLSAPAAQYKELTLDKVAATGSFQGGKLDATVKAGLPGGQMEATAALAYAAQAADGASVILTKPSLSWRASLKTSDGGKAVAPFLPAAQVAKLRPLLAGALSFDGAGAVKGRAVSITDGTLYLMGTTLGITAASRRRTARRAATPSP